MEITRNQNYFDRFVKIIVGGVVLLLASCIPMHPIFFWILVGASFYLMLTGLAGNCPLYSALGINTAKK